MKITTEHSSDGVTVRQFELTVAGNVVPGVLWTPEEGRGSRPLLLVGHGGGQHKLAPPVETTALRYVKSLGWAVAAIDAPEHGARIGPEEAARIGARDREQIARAGGIRGEALETSMRRAAAAQPEWTATLDALAMLDGVGAPGGALGPVGYAGMSMGAHLGIPFIAGEPRIKAAVLGGAGISGDEQSLAQAARRITIPLLFAMQWDDEFVARDEAFALYAAFGSRDKTLHANTGGHREIPAFERSTWEAFLLHHLGALAA